MQPRHPVSSFASCHGEGERREKKARKMIEEGGKGKRGGKRGKERSRDSPLYHCCERKCGKKKKTPKNGHTAYSEKEREKREEGWKEGRIETQKHTLILLKI